MKSGDELEMWLKSTTPEAQVPSAWLASDDGKKGGASSTSLQTLLMIQALRPDRVPAAATQYVKSVLGDNLLSSSEQELDLPAIVEDEIKAGEPVLMCSVPGYDASNRVDDLAAHLNKQMTSIAIGSSEGFDQAEKSINSASRSGRWVMLKNVHLAPAWLVQLEKKIHTLQPHPAFRLFLTMEINPKVPVNLLRAGRIFVFEPPPGVRANLLSTFNRIATPQRVQKAPAERARLYFLLAWFHAVVQERLRYAPLGWSKVYEFNDSDLRCACDTIDTWIDTAGKGRDNIPPDKVPWNAIRTLFSQAVYGGRIDNEFDQRLLNSFLDRMFVVKSFDHEFSLVRKVDEMVRDIKMPESAIHHQDFVDWIERLPEKQTPSWLGLPNNAEKLLLTAKGSELARSLMKTQLLDDDDDLAYGAEQASSDKSADASEADGRPQWMKSLLLSARTWRSLIPTQLHSLRRTADNIKDPLFRYFEREVTLGVKLLSVVRCDLDEAISVCEGKKKQTNYHRSLLDQLNKGLLPTQWNKYKVPAGWSVIQWVTDFSQRIEQLDEVTAANASGVKALKSMAVWLGGLFVPEAYITATRQYVAQQHSISLEELSLSVNVVESNGNTTTDNRTFAVSGLILQGAVCKNNKLSLCTDISTKLPMVMLSWNSTPQKQDGKVTLPIYRNGMRTDLLFTLAFHVEQDETSFHERGVAILSAD